MGVQASSKMSLSLSIPQDKILGRGICAGQVGHAEGQSRSGRTDGLEVFVFGRSPLGGFQPAVVGLNGLKIVAFVHAILFFSLSAKAFGA